MAISREDLSLAIAYLTAIYNEGAPEEPSERAIAEELSRTPAVRYLLDSIPAWLWQTDADHRFVFISPQFENLTGMQVARLLGHTRSMLIGAGTAIPMNVKNHDAVLAEKEPFRNFRYDLKAPNDRTYSVNISGWPVWQDDARTVFRGYIGIGFDISDERVRIADMVETRIADIISERTFLGDAMNALDVSVLILDPEHRIEYFNRRWEELHAAMSRRYRSKGIPYEDYLRTAISLKLFPEAIGDEENFIRQRIRRNLEPEATPFMVKRQCGIVLSIYVTKIAGTRTAIISTELRSATRDRSITA